MITFRQIRSKLAPRWLVSGAGELVGYSLDLVKDAFIERLRLGKLAHFPQQGPDGQPAPRDALDRMARDRRIFHARSETDAELAVRLLPWLDNRKTTGNPFTLMKRLAEYCGPLPSYRTVDDHGNWYSRAADGTETSSIDAGNWNWDGQSVVVKGTDALEPDPTNEDPGVWSRFWVIIYPNGLWTTGDGSWNGSGSGGTEEAWGETANADGSPLGWGCTATTDDVAMLRAIVADNMPAGTRCVNIILDFSALPSFDPSAPEPDGHWGRWSKTMKVGTKKRSVPSRLSTARYLDGV